MKKRYQTAEIEIIRFQDVIITSSNITETGVVDPSDTDDLD